MHPFVAEIIECLKGVNVGKLAGPPDEVEENDHVVGVMSVELRRLWGLREKMRRKLRELERALHIIKFQHLFEPNPPPEFLERSREFLLADSDDDAMNELFWAAVRREFPEIAGRLMIGVRKGWKVVWSEKDEEEEHPIAALIQLLGRRGPPRETPPSDLAN